MLDKKDAQWWTLEVQKHPESAADLVRMLADRLAFLDKQNEELRGELITLRRKQRGGDTDVSVLQQRIKELEAALRQNDTEQRLLIYASDRIEANITLSTAHEDGIGRELPGDVAMLRCGSGSAAKLVVVTAESQVFNVLLSDLPSADDGPAMLGNPRNIAAILDQSVFEHHRFLALLSRSGYVYSLIAGTLSQALKRGDKLIRNLVPDDPIVAAVPSYNADLFALSQKGRWTRFIEKAIAGTGSPVMELPKGDALISLIALSTEGALTFLTTDGKLFVRPSADFATRKAPGTFSGMVVKGQSFLGVSAADDLLILTRRGKLIKVRVEELPFRAQTESGVQLPGLAADDSILAWA